MRLSAEEEGMKAGCLDGQSKKKPWFPSQGFDSCGSCDVLVFVACMREEFG
jgi:hypothetical protein